MEYESWLEKIISMPSLNGGGTYLAPIFAELLQGHSYETAFEWCAGPAWIGCLLLEQKICKHLVTGDINPDSVACVEATKKINQYNISPFCSNNMESIPEYSFDLVVANPPNYCNIQATHPFGFLRDDLRPSDIDWHIHDDFYKTITKYLHSSSKLFISEVAVDCLEVYFGDDLYDKRSIPPIEVFCRMLEQNNLELVNRHPYVFDNVPCDILEISTISC